MLKNWCWLRKSELRQRLASAYRAGWEDGMHDTPFLHGYWINQDLAGPLDKWVERMLPTRRPERPVPKDTRDRRMINE